MKDSVSPQKVSVYFTAGLIVGLVIVLVFLPLITSFGQSSTDRAVDFIMKYVETVDTEEPDIVRVQNARSLLTEESTILENVENDDLILLFSDKAVIYRESVDKIIYVLELSV